MTEFETPSSNPDIQPDQHGHFLKSFHPNYEPKTVQEDVYRREAARPTSDVEGAVRSHTEHQPAPVRLEGQPSVPVLPYVLQDFRDKALVGLDKYHTMLRTNNGRDALADAYQEAVDKVMYLKQHLMEQDIRDGKDALWLVDADIALEESWWKQREEQGKQTAIIEDFAMRERLLNGKVEHYQDRAEHYQNQYASAVADIGSLLKMLRKVALQKYEATVLLDMLLGMYKKYGEE